MTRPVTVRTTEIGGLVFEHDEQVLAPRPWTAAQAIWARQLSDELPAGPILELCGGVGHIGLLALVGNDRSLVMVDANEAACRFALANAHAAGLAERVEIRHSRFESALDTAETFGLVLADPPWVPSDRVADFPEDPVSAIDGGADGLVVARACLELAERHLHPDGRCLIQLGTRTQVEELAAWLADGSSLMIEQTRTFERGVLALVGRAAR